MFRCARCSGTGRPAAVNAPAVTRAGSRRPGACQGTNIASRSTVGTAYCLGWAVRDLEPGLFVIAFTYVLDRWARGSQGFCACLTQAHDEPSASLFSHARRRPATPADV